MSDWKKPTTPEQKAELQKLGYGVENMGPYHPMWDGFWRWTHDDYGPDAEPQTSEELAWSDALSYSKHIEKYLRVKS
jgi:hypothetical protein